MLNTKHEWKNIKWMIIYLDEQWIYTEYSKGVMI